MQIKFNIPQAEQVDSSGDFRSRRATSSLVFARSLAVDLWQVYSHFCVARTVGLECVCPTGLTVKQDGKTCEDSKSIFF